MRKLSSLSVFFPVFNDEKSISTLVNKAARLLPKIASSYEIIIINDGSKDNTSIILKKLKKQIPFLRIITHKVNKGYGAALKSGFQNAKKNSFFILMVMGNMTLASLKIW